MMMNDAWIRWTLHLAMGLAAAGLMTLTGCAAPRAEVWPIYHREAIVDAAGDDAVRREILYPFFETQHSDARRSLVVRPLFDLDSMPQDGRWRLRYLWPFGLVLRREDRGDLYRLWPLVQHSRTVAVPSGEASTHGWVLPLVFWGERPDQGTYRGLMPVAGRTYGLLGEEFSWVLFPCYSLFRQGSYRRHNLLWPLFSYGEDPERAVRTRRAWPVYVRKEKEDVYSHQYLFWPLFRYGFRQWPAGRDAVRRSDYRAFHPFYASVHTRDADGELVARQRQILSYNRLWDSRRPDDRHWSVLFSLIRRRRTGEGEEWRFFPVFWQTLSYAPDGTNAGYRTEQQRIAWPLIWRRMDRSWPERERLHVVVAPLLWYYRTHQLDEDTVEQSTTLWPALTVSHAPDGERVWYVPSHGWRDGAGGYKRIYRPFFEWFRFSVRPDGHRETRLLWRLYHHRRGPDERRLNVGPLFSYERVSCDDEGTSRTVSFFFGLMRHESH